MAKTIKVDTLPKDVASKLSSPGEPVFLEQNGERVGVVVSPELFRHLEISRDRLFNVMDRIAEKNPMISEEGLQDDVELAIREVRVEQN